MPNRARVAPLAFIAALILSPPAFPAGASGTASRAIMMARIYTSEVPPTTGKEANFIRMAVIIPPGSMVAKVEAFMALENFGRSTGGWRPCDLGNGVCEMAEGRVHGLRRIRYPDRDEVLLDFWNEHPDASRFAKLRVTFLPQGNLRKTYVPKECWLKVECGYAGWMDEISSGDRGEASRD
ncbi:MAG: hypothetical protein JSW21_02120 [Gammaproteobacteria bacterium]|nr:MAG: hypothetical protein JSW21_02120 [Gammaproteobacteria bacterium]